MRRRERAPSLARRVSRHPARPGKATEAAVATAQRTLAGSPGKASTPARSRDRPGKLSALASAGATSSRGPPGWCHHGAAAPILDWATGLIDSLTQPVTDSPITYLAIVAIAALPGYVGGSLTQDRSWLAMVIGFVLSGSLAGAIALSQRRRNLISALERR
jgi:hypothetical protein